MKNIVALINLHDSPTLGILTDKRPIASTTFLGRYTFIDFAISNLTNSGIDDISVLISDHFRSVVKHLRSDATYLKNPKTGYFNTLINEEGLKNPFFNTDVNNIRANDYFLYEPSSQYVIIVPVGFITKIDYTKVMNEHFKSGKPVSCVYFKSNNAGKDFRGLSKLTINALGNVQKVARIEPEDKECYVDLRTYIFNKSLLKEIIQSSAKVSHAITISEVMTYLQKYSEYGVHAIYHDGPVKYVDSLQKYYDVSMEMKDLMAQKDESYFGHDWKVLTRTHDSRPVLYGLNCDVKNSLIANGCTINGTVKNSILARNVIVEEGAVVENSIIFTDSVIKKGVHLDGVISDKLCHFESKTEVKSNDGELVYIPQGEHI